MPENEGVITFRGRAEQLQQELNKVQATMVRTGKHAEDLGTKIGNKVGKSLEHAVLKTFALVEAMKKAGEAFEKIREEKIEASKTVGEAQLEAQVAGARLGISGDLASALLEGEGGRTLSERAGFLKRLASKSGKEGYSALQDTGTLVKATGLYNSKLYEEDEIEEAIQNGTLDQLGAENRGNSLIGNAKLQYRTEARERALEIATANARARQGFGKRFTDVEVGYLDASRSDLARGVMGAVDATTGIVGVRLIQTLDRIASSNEELVEYARGQIVPAPAE